MVIPGSLGPSTQPFLFAVTRSHHFTSEPIVGYFLWDVSQASRLLRLCAKVPLQSFDCSFFFLQDRYEVSRLDFRNIPPWRIRDVSYAFFSELFYGEGIMVAIILVVRNHFTVYRFSGNSFGDERHVWCSFALPFFSKGRRAVVERHQI